MTRSTSRDSLIAATSPLAAGDAVAAIICVEGDGYLMQLRDARPDIWYPDHWGLFGGAIDPGEEPIQALRRELLEELELEVGEAEFFAGSTMISVGSGCGATSEVIISCRSAALSKSGWCCTKAPITASFPEPTSCPNPTSPLMMRLRCSFTMREAG